MVAGLKYTSRRESYFSVPNNSTRRPQRRNVDCSYQSTHMSITERLPIPASFSLPFLVCTICDIHTPECRAHMEMAFVEIKSDSKKRL